MHFSLLALFFALTAANLNVLQWCQTHLQALPLQNPSKPANLPPILPSNEFVRLGSNKSSLFICSKNGTNVFDLIRSCFDSVDAKNTLFLESLKQGFQPGSVQQWEFVSRTVYQRLIDALQLQKQQFVKCEREKIVFERKLYTVEKRHLGSFVDGPLHPDWSLRIHLELTRKDFYCTRLDEDEKLAEFVAFAAERADYLFPETSNLVSRMQFPLTEEQITENQLKKLERALSSADLQQEFILRMQTRILNKLTDLNFTTKEVSLQDWNQKIVSFLNLFPGVPFYPQFNHLSLCPEFSVGELTKGWNLEQHEIDREGIIEQLSSVLYAKRDFSTALKTRSIVRTVISNFENIHNKKVQMMLEQQQREHEQAVQIAKQGREFKMKVFVVVFVMFLLILGCLLLLIRKKTYKKQTSFY